MMKTAMFVYSGNLMFYKPFTKQENFRLVQIQSVVDDKLILAQIMKFVLYRIENNVGKGENGYQHFSSSYIVFKRASSSR